MITTIMAYVLCPFFVIIGLLTVAIAALDRNPLLDKPNTIRFAFVCFFAAHACAFMGGI